MTGQRSTTIGHRGAADDPHAPRRRPRTHWPRPLEAVDLSPSPFGRGYRTDEAALHRVLTSLRTSLVQDVAPEAGVIRETVALALANAHAGADDEELETLLLTLRRFLGALIESAEATGQAASLDDVLPAARRLLGQAPDGSVHNYRSLIMRLAGAIHDIGERTDAVERGVMPP